MSFPLTFAPSFPVARPSNQPLHHVTKCPRRERLPFTPAATISPPKTPPLLSPSEISMLEWKPRELHSTDEFDDLKHAATASGRPLILLFHAKHCRACKFVVPKFRKLASAHANVALATVLYTDARELSMRLGVVQVPILQVYQGDDGLVDEFSCGINGLERMRHTVEMLNQGSRYRKAEQNEGN